jgi:RND family efflux transporter MFP subunit
MGKLAAGVGLALLLLIMACGESNVYAPPPPPQVTVVQPQRQPVEDHLEFTGNTQAVNTVQLRARVQGFLEKVFFRDGDVVKKGQLLFLIQPNTYQAELERAEAQVLQQKANYDHAVIETARYTKLVQQKAAAQTDLDNWRFQRDAYKAAMLAAEAARDLAKLNLEYTRVMAPFDGRIDRRLKDPGNLVGAGEFTLLAEINQIDPIYVYFTINETELLKIMHQAVETPEGGEKLRTLYLGLANETGHPHKGYFDFAAITVNPTTGTQQLRGVFHNPDFKILPGLFARIKAPVVGSKKEGLLVPDVALGYDQLGPYVLVVDDKNVVQRRGVKIGAKVDYRRVIEEGLSGDEAVIVSGQLRAIPGRPVTPVRETEKSAPAAGSAPPPGKPQTSAP